MSDSAIKNFFHVLLWVLVIVFSYVHFWVGTTANKLTGRFVSPYEVSALGSKNPWEILGWSTDIGWIASYQEFIAPWSPLLILPSAVGMLIGVCFSLVVLAEALPARS